MAFEPVKIDERVFVPNLHRAGGQIIRRDPDPLIDVFHFRVVRLGRAIRKHYTLVDEIMIVRKIAEATAIREKLALGVAAIPDALILPFPNRAAHQGWIFIKDIMVIARSAE